LQGYSNIGESIAAYGGPDWRTSTSRVGENDGKFGAAVERTSVTGSPVVPGSALKILAEADQVLYAVTVLKGHYQIGVLVDDVFTNGEFYLVNWPSLEREQNHKKAVPLVSFLHFSSLFTHTSPL